MFFASIGTPGMTAPLVSETVPVSVPRSVCANADSVNTNRPTTATTRWIFMGFSLCEANLSPQGRIGKQKRDEIPSLTSQTRYFVFFSERDAGDNLAGARLRSGAVHPVDVAVATGELVLIVSGRRRERIRAGCGREAAGLDRNRTREVEPVENVLEFRANLELHVPFTTHKEEPADAQGFRRLTLPAILIEIRCRRSEL